jgi:hypothetical protein
MEKALKQQCWWPICGRGLGRYPLTSWAMTAEVDRGRSVVSGLLSLELNTAETRCPIEPVESETPSIESSAVRVLAGPNAGNLARWPESCAKIGWVWVTDFPTSCCRSCAPIWSTLTRLVTSVKAQLWPKSNNDLTTALPKSKPKLHAAGDLLVRQRARLGMKRPKNMTIR